jgi:dihydrolipoamide dehydrogenase
VVIGGGYIGMVMGQMFNKQAIGDVAGGAMLAHKATHEGEICAEVIAGHNDKDDRILGVTICGDHANDLISEAALAIEMDAEALDVGLTIHPHPTLGEGLMESAKTALGQAIHVVNK